MRGSKSKMRGGSLHKQYTFNMRDIQEEFFPGLLWTFADLPGDEDDYALPDFSGNLPVNFDKNNIRGSVNLNEVTLTDQIRYNGKFTIDANGEIEFENFGAPWNVDSLKMILKTVYVIKTY